MIQQSTYAAWRERLGLKLWPQSLFTQTLRQVEAAIFRSILVYDDVLSFSPSSSYASGRMLEAYAEQIYGTARTRSETDEQLRQRMRDRWQTAWTIVVPPGVDVDFQLFVPGGRPSIPRERWCAWRNRLLSHKVLLGLRCPKPDSNPYARTGPSPAASLFAAAWPRNKTPTCSVLQIQPRRLRFPRGPPRQQPPASTPGALPARSGRSRRS